jgi:hypothetical protein
MRVMNEIRRKLPLVQANVICVLLFLAGILVIVQHANWFG